MFFVFVFFSACVCLCLLVCVLLFVVRRRCSPYEDNFLLHPPILVVRCIMYGTARNLGGQFVCVFVLYCGRLRLYYNRYDKGATTCYPKCCALVIIVKHVQAACTSMYVFSGFGVYQAGRYYSSISINSVIHRSRRSARSR